MIRIKVNDMDLDVGDLKISFKFTNPLLTDKMFSEGYSFPFSLPYSDRNISLLSNSNRLDDRRIKRKFFVKIYFNNMFLFSGYFTVKNINNSYYNCYFNSQSLDVTKQLQDTNLRDLNLKSFTVCDEVDNATVKQSKWRTRMVAQSQIIAFKRPDEVITHYFPPIHCPYAYDTETTANSDETATGFVKNHWWSQFINFFSDDEEKLMVGNKVHADTYAVRPGWQTTISPCPNFVYVLEQALAKFNFILDKTELLSLVEIDQLFIFSNNVMDKVESYSTYKYNTYGLGYSLQDFLPDTNALELPKALKTLFNAVFYVQDGRIKVVAGKTLLKQQAVDWSAYTEYAFAKEFTDLYNYDFEFKDSTNDDYVKLYPGQFEKTTIDNSEDKTESVSPDSMRPLATRVNPRGNVWGFWATAAHEETVIGAINGPLLFTFENPTSLGHNSPVKSDESENSPTDVIKALLLGVWRGEEFNASNYPSAVNQAVDDADIRYGENSILWGGEDGLVENFQKDFIEFINGASVFSKQLYLPAHKLAKFIEFEQIKYSFKHPKGNMTGIIKDFDFELSNNGISPIKANFLMNENE